MNQASKITVLIPLFAIVALGNMESTITYTRAEEPSPAEIVLAEVSAYTSSPEETDEDPFTTANGDRVGPGTIACPSRFPFGTKLLIEKREYTCNDRMNARYRETNHFDIWFETKAQAIEFGRKKLEVAVISPVIHTK